MTTRKELIEGVGARYRSAPMSEKSKILDEFVAITGYHRIGRATRVQPWGRHANLLPR